MKAIKILICIIFHNRKYIFRMFHKYNSAKLSYSSSSRTRDQITHQTGKLRLERIDSGQIRILQSDA